MYESGHVLVFYWLNVNMDKPQTTPECDSDYKMETHQKDDEEKER